MADQLPQTWSLETPYREDRFDRAVSQTLLDQLLGAGVGVDTAADYRAPELVERFLNSGGERDCAAILFGRSSLSRMTLREYQQELAGLICRIETLVAEQIHQILHHVAFQKLEASWRGLKYLVVQAERSLREGARSAHVRLQVLDVSQEELRKSFSRAVEFDQSDLFRKIYQQGFGQAGGEPFGLLLGDYEFQSSVRDCELLRLIAGVAASAFAPFVAAASPALLGLEDFSQLNRPFQLSAALSGPEFAKWRSYRSSPDAKFVSLIAPRVVYRAPYSDNGRSLFGFRFHEDVSGKVSQDGSDSDVGRYLWGNPCYAFGSVVIRSFCRTGWFAEIRGMRTDEIGGGMVDGLPQISFETESEGQALRPPTEIVLSRHWEDEFARHGLIPVADCQDSPYALFPSNSSTYQGERTAQDQKIVENERLSAMTQYVLCASRFAHYLKVIARNKLGNTDSPLDLQDELNGRWLQHYVSQTAHLNPHERAKYPLREGWVDVSTIPDQPGAYELKLYLCPRFQLDDVEVGISLKTLFSP